MTLGMSGRRIEIVSIDWINFLGIPYLGVFVVVIVVIIIIVVN